MSDGSSEEYPSYCAICGEMMDGSFHKGHPNPVCDDCDSRAVTRPGESAQMGDNPVYIDGIQCFRRYKMGGWLSQRDPFECEDWDEFYDKHYDEYGPIHTFNEPNPPTGGRDIRQLSNIDNPSDDGITARVIENDILDESADALLCGITTDPSLRNGVAGAVCDASDHAIRPQVLSKVPNQLGDVVVTGGFDLPYSYLIFAAATRGHPNKGATEESVHRAIEYGLQKAAELGLPSVALPLIGTGAGGLDTRTAASGIVSGIEASGVSPPVCVRIVSRNADDCQIVEKVLAEATSDANEEATPDPLEGTIAAQMERVDRSGDPSEWEVYPWIRFDPYTGEILDSNVRDPSQQTLRDYGHPDEAMSLIEETQERFVDDEGVPEQWFSWFKSFNSQMGGRRVAVDHPELDRQLYNGERALVGAIRGLEHPDSAYSGITELVLDHERDGDRSETTVRLRYQVPEGRFETNTELTESCLQTALRVVEYTVETMSHLDFGHEMSDLTEVTPADRIEVIANAYSRTAFDVAIPIDLAHDVVASNLSPAALRSTALRCESYLD